MTGIWCCRYVFFILMGMRQFNDRQIGLQDEVQRMMYTCQEAERNAATLAQNFKPIDIFENVIILILVVFGTRRSPCAPLDEVMYSFQYGIEAPHLGLLTHHREERKGDLVRGSYSLLERDGRIRIVEYKVDGNRGFRAFVTYRKPPGQPLRGHLKFPHYYKRPIHLAEPVGFITADILRGSKTYPNLPV